MKKMLFVCLATLIAVSVNAQTFALTQEGFIDSNDETKDYLVIEMEGTQAELYSKVKNYLYSIYKSPKDVLSESEPDIITINGIERDAVQKKAMGMIATSYDMNYSISVRFKDGRIRINAPTFTLSDYDTGAKPIKLILCGKANGGMGSEVINVIYTTNGKLKEEYAKVALENFFNSYVQRLSSSNIIKDNDEW